MDADTTTAKRNRPLTEAEVARIVELFTDYELAMGDIGILYRRSGKQIRQILWQAGVRIRTNQRGTRVPDEQVAAMYADYMAGKKMAEIARAYGRTGSALSELFRRRGLQIREYRGPQCHKADGTWVAAEPLTPAEIQQLIDEAKDIAIPKRLAIEWRKWDLARRADFVDRLRARLGPELPDPALFSANVEFFKYGSPRAHALMDKINAGTDSRSLRVKINLKSWGVIFEDLLWCANPQIGFVQGPWDPVHGRPALHQVIYRRHHGEVPAGHVIRPADGNKYNLDPGNLVAVTRNELCRENQAKTLLKQSRDRVGILLKRQTTNSTDSHALVRKLAS
jgi:hypothetical protein